MTDTAAPEEPAFDEWEHREAAKKIKAIYTNQIYVQPLADGMVRINFGDVMDDEPSYHTAIVLSPPNALQFSQLVQKMASTMLAQTLLNRRPPAEQPSVSDEPEHGEG